MSRFSDAPTREVNEYARHIRDTLPATEQYYCKAVEIMVPSSPAPTLREQMLYVKRLRGTAIALLNLIPLAMHIPIVGPCSL